MRVPPEQQTGNTGATEVTAKLERLGWGVADNTRHDVGTDLLASARDLRGVDLGLVIGIQVKTGDTGVSGGKYFSEPQTDPDSGEVTGWWFRDPDRRHIDAWLRHELPHLVVLHDLHTNSSYWVHVTDDVVIPTGKGAKIFVPRTRTIDGEHRDELLAVAASQRPKVEWEGSFWNGPASLTPAEVLRHALIVPRLVAPHPNLTQTAPLGPEQAVALLMRAQLGDLTRRLEPGRLDADLDQALDRPDWRWQFARALYRRFTSGSIDHLLTVLAEAPAPAERAAATVVTAATLVEEGLVDRADELLLSALERDDADSVDHAWLELQHARCLSDLGHVDEARDYALAAQRVRSALPGDLTASAIGGQAAVSVFQLTRWGEGNLAEGASGGDTTASWWRTLTTSEGLTDSADEAFKRWGHDISITSITFGGRDGVDDLAAASLMAGYLGSHGTWCHLSGLRARELLMRLDRTSDPQDASTALNTLRLAGDHKSVELATGRFVRDGPADAVTETARQIDLDSLTATTARSSLALLRCAGDVLDIAIAQRTCSWLLVTFADPSTFFRRNQLGPGYQVELIDTLVAVVASAPAETLARVTDYVADLPAQSDPLAARSWANLVRSLPPAAWSADATRRLRDAAPTHEERLRTAVYEAVAEHDAAVRDELLPLIDQGSQAALSAFGDVRDLPASTVATYIAGAAARCHEIQEMAERLSHAAWADDAPSDLALLNAWHPASADWDSLVALLEDPAVWPSDKNGVLNNLALLASQLPEPVRDRLRNIADRLAAAPPLPHPAMFDDAPHSHGPALALAMALEEHAGPVPVERHRQLLALLTGDPTERRWAARIAGSASETIMVGLLATLLNDAEPSVRAAAVVGLLRHAEQRPDATSLTEAALEQALNDPGTLVARALASTFTQRTERPLTSTAIAVLRRLRAHRSAATRALATEALDAQETPPPEAPES